MRCVSSFWPMYTAAMLSQEIPSGFPLSEERRSKQGRGWGTEDLLILGSHRDPGMLENRDHLCLHHRSLECLHHSSSEQCGSTTVPDETLVFCWFFFFFMSVWRSCLSFDKRWGPGFSVCPTSPLRGFIFRLITAATGRSHTLSQGCLTALTPH